MEKLKLKSNNRVKFSIALKLGLLLATFAILACGLTGYYTYHSTRDILTRKATRDISQSSQVIGQRFSIMALAAANDARFLAQTRLVIQSFDSGSATKKSRQMLADQFKSLLLVHPEYFQIRFISAQHYGIELVRADHDTNHIDLINGLNLQEKQQYPYVYETLKLAKGQIYFSKLIINHERGAHAGYKQPTLQVATPVIDQAGVKLGVIVININLKQIFAMLKTALNPDYQLYMTNQAGDYLIHPDSAMTFGFDKGRRFLAQNTFKPVSRIVNETANTATVHTTEQQDVIGGFARIPFGSLKKHRFVIIGLTVPLKFVLADTDILAKNTQHIVIAFSLLAIMLSSFMAIVFVRPLKHLLLAVQRFSNTKELTPVMLGNQDELGMLARNINLMQVHILTHLNDLNQQNKVLNKEIAERVQIEQFEKFRNHILELLTSKVSLTEILTAIVLRVEELKPNMLCSILQLSQDGQHLASGIAPSLPDFYNAAIHGIEIGPCVASCGTAAFTRERVIVADIQTHPDWAPYKAIAAQAHLGSCWSQPILSSSAQVLGTFTIYHHDVHTPSESDIYFIELCARLASIAIEHKQSEYALHYSEQRFRDVSEAAGEYIWEIDPNMVYTYISKQSAHVKGYTPEELLGHTSMEFMLDADISIVGKAITQAINNKAPFKLQHRNISKTGELLWEEVSGLPFYNESGCLIGLRGTGLNITKRIAAEVEIKNLAFYDSLTRLPNRRLLLDRLKQALISNIRNHREGALLFIDLDNFKSLNDTLGHDMGDLLLQQVAQRLVSSVREGDTVSRLGGDEFVIILEDLGENLTEAAAQTKFIAEKILTELNLPYQLVNHEYCSTPSIGATLFNCDSKTADELMKHADIAMYQAKKSGRNTLRFFDPIMQKTVMVRAQMESNLRLAIVEQKEFQLYYQPQVEPSGKIIGAEALVRWISPQRGIIAPGEFITIAENSGLILPLGHWVLLTACQQLAIWAKKRATAHLTLAVNISARQFRNPNFVTEILILIDNFDVDPTKLKLEITESMTLDNIDETIAKMTFLQSHHIKFSMDDFGTGYSSLQYLKRLPLSQLKIDQSFVRDIEDNSSDRAIVRTVIVMAHSLDLNVIAEGVETENQRNILLKKGCTHFQGYLFGKPMPIDEFEIRLKSG